MSPALSGMIAWLGAALALAALQASLAVAALLALEARARDSRLRAALLVLVGIKLVTPPWLAWPVVLARAPAAAPAPIAALAVWLGGAFLVCWGLGSLVSLGRLVSQRLRLERERERAIAITAGPEHEALRAAAAALGVATPRLFLSDEARAPYAAGHRRPYVALPRAWCERLTREDLACVLLHEVAHVRRRDPLRLELAAALGILWWWNPLVHRAGQRWRQAIEDACDDRVLSRDPGEPGRYCAALLHAARLAADGPEPRFAGSAAMSAAAMEARIRRLMSGGRPASPRAMAFSTAGLILLAAVVIPYLGGLSLPAGPGRHAVLHAARHGAGHVHPSH